MTREELISADGTARVVFGMPEDEYHAEKAVGSSDVRNLLVSSFTYWANSYRNPDREVEDTDAKDYGKAYHKLILEGRQAFDAAYAVELDPKDYPDHLKSGDQLKKRCEDLGQSKSGTLADMAQRIRHAEEIQGHEPRTKFWADTVAEHEAQNEGRVFISAKDMRRLNTAYYAICESEAWQLLEIGIAEVSIFWTDPATGVRCKGRLDKLRPNHLLDAKSFSNSKKMDLLSSVGNSIANYRYAIQTVMYAEGLEYVISKINDPRLGVPNKQVETTLIFQESSSSPNVVIYDLVPHNGDQMNAYHVKAHSDFHMALDLFLHCEQKYGEKPWVNAQKRRALRDDDLPAYYFK